MTTETHEPLVAVLFGAMAHESLAAQIMATVDLVAGQLGPWSLSDDARAARAAELVDRLGQPTDLFSLLGEVRRELGEVWEAHRATMPGYLLHEVEQLEQRVGSFVDSYRDSFTVLVATPAADAPGDPTPPAGPPSHATALEWRRDQWITFLQQAGVPIPGALAALRAHAEATGLVPPTSLGGVVGVEPFVAFLLQHVIEVTEQAR